MIVTVFDWDDTLMATTHLIQSKLPLTFPELSKSIKRLLNVALAAGHVYIITNAEIAWVQKCIDENLIDCTTILNRVHMISTVDTGISKITTLEMRKIVAFSRIKGLFNKRGRMHQLICMGDCIYDREASLTLKDSIEENAYVKNVKFLHHPDLQTILFQQKTCIDNYNILLRQQCHLDLMLSDSSSSPLPFRMQYSSLSADQLSELSDLSDLSELSEEDEDQIPLPIEPESWFIGKDSVSHVIRPVTRSGSTNFRSKTPTFLSRSIKFLSNITTSSESKPERSVSDP